MAMAMALPDKDISSHRLVMPKVDRVQKKTEAKTREDRRRRIIVETMKREHDEIVDRAQALLNDGGVMGFFRSLVYRIWSWLGFDPLEWLRFVDENEHNARIARKKSSTDDSDSDSGDCDSDLWNDLAKAGEVFIRRQSPHLQTSKQAFSATISSAKDANRMAESIIAFCKCLPAAVQVEPLSVDVNDIKLVLAQVIKAALDSSSVKQTISVRRSMPIIGDEGAVAWVQYKFDSKLSIISSCCSTEKNIDITVEKKYFVFPNEASFRDALRRLEEKL